MDRLTAFAIIWTYYFFTFNSNIFLVIHLVFGDAQVYTGLALFLVSENNILNAFAKIMWIVTPSKPLEINLCLKIIWILDITG